MPEVPVLDRFVPRTGDEDRSSLAGDIDEAYTANRLIMRSDLLSGGLAGGKVDHAGCFIGARAHDFGTVLEEMLSM